ncbi:hypothetical protein VKT23_018028 [Stygiomarasmius scandens]|uniref:Uncharacterized protein n=1 Tax=Marasmiellus scandens TaxID=2682957 RepID=A0ABR1IUH5_9AGAR
MKLGKRSAAVSMGHCKHFRLEDGKNVFVVFGIPNASQEKQTWRVLPAWMEVRLMVTARVEDLPNGLRDTLKFEERMRLVVLS